MPPPLLAVCSCCGAEGPDTALAVTYIAFARDSGINTRPPVEVQCRGCFAPTDRVSCFELSPRLDELRCGTWPRGLWRHHGFFSEADKDDE